MRYSWQNYWAPSKLGYLSWDWQPAGREQRWTWRGATPFFPRAKPRVGLRGQGSRILHVAVEHPQLKLPPSLAEAAARGPSCQKPQPDFALSHFCQGQPWMDSPGTSRNRDWNRALEADVLCGREPCRPVKPAPLRLGARNGNGSNLRSTPSLLRVGRS